MVLPQLPRGNVASGGGLGGSWGAFFFSPPRCLYLFLYFQTKRGAGGGKRQRLAAPRAPSKPPSPFSWVRRGPGGSWRGPRGSPAGAHEGSEWTPGGSGESRCGSGEDPGGVRGGSSGRIGQPRGGGVGYGEPCQAVGTGVRGGAQAPHPLSGTSTGARGSVCSAPPHALPVCPPP